MHLEDIELGTFDVRLMKAGVRWCVSQNSSIVVIGTLIAPTVRSGRRGSGSPWEPSLNSARSPRKRRAPPDGMNDGLRSVQMRGETVEHLRRGFESVDGPGGADK